jgi:hypothetical protein
VYWKKITIIGPRPVWITDTNTLKKEKEMSYDNKYVNRKLEEKKWFDKIIFIFHIRKKIRLFMVHDK